MIPFVKLKRSRSLCWPARRRRLARRLSDRSTENPGRRVGEPADDERRRSAYGRCTAKKELTTAGMTSISILEQEECRVRARFAAFPARLYRSRRRAAVVVDVRRRELGRRWRWAAERLCRGRWGGQ